MIPYRQFRWMVVVATAMACAVGVWAQPSITPAVLPGGEVGQNPQYSQTLNANDVLPTCCNWSVSSGALPDGLQLSTGVSPTATITGTPTNPGMFNFMI